MDTAIESGLNVITRLRDDAVLHYAPPPKKEGQMGRPKKYGDRFSVQNPQTEQLPCIAQTEGQRIFGGVVYIKSLKRLVKIALVQELKEDGTVKSVKIFICTDLEFPAQDIWPLYKSRFQIEFLYHDAKQHTWLENTQSRHPKALEYHFNMSLTSVLVVTICPSTKASEGPFRWPTLKRSISMNWWSTECLTCLPISRTSQKIIPLSETYTTLAKSLPKALRTIVKKNQNESLFNDCNAYG